MITVDVVQEKSEEPYYLSYLQLDGELFTEVRPRRVSKGKIIVDVRNTVASQRLAIESFNELSLHFCDLSFVTESNIAEMFPVCSVVSEDLEKQSQEVIAFNLRPALSRWTKPWSYVQYLDTFWDELANRKNPRFTQIDDEFSIKLRSVGPHAVQVNDFDKNEPLSTIIESSLQFLCEIHVATERKLTASLNRGSLVTFFDFPPTVKVACEQYLQYFIQFLEDLGIEADSEISSNAGKVLFSVTPRSGEEALDAIQKALEAYLSLPTDNDLGRQGLLSGDISHTQLQAQIYHLQGQLMTAQGMMQLSKATIEAKNETINAQAMQISLFQRQQLIQSSTSEIKVLESSKPTQLQDSEPLLGEMVKVVPIKSRGFEIDLPGILRKLKRKIPNGKP